ncbi:hypothetical protein [Litchfieldella xinjiangensis]|uniref:hypothetical protein n=1 Tax=Litchfieldella xinjiangensis TaxID=1166948 RepID=UPI0005BCFFC6|nr:hypothetical protein [Halomonas xinjiangensis]
MTARDADVKPSVFERHLQTGIQVILVALLAWAGLELVNLGKNTAVLQERLMYQGQQIADLRRELRQWNEIYYRQADAERDFDDIRKRIEGLDGRVSTLEGVRQ